VTGGNDGKRLTIGVEPHNTEENIRNDRPDTRPPGTIVIKTQTFKKLQCKGG